MSRPYTTISEQTVYDVTVQKFGGLDDIDELMRSVEDINYAIPFGTDLTLEDTDDALALNFDVNKIHFATGDEGPDPVDDDCEAFNYLFNYKFCKEPDIEEGNDAFPYTFPHTLL